MATDRFDAERDRFRAVNRQLDNFRAAFQKIADNPDTDLTVSNNCQLVASALTNHRNTFHFVGLVDGIALHPVVANSDSAMNGRNFPELVRLTLVGPTNKALMERYKHRENMKTYMSDLTTSELNERSLDLD